MTQSATTQAYDFIIYLAADWDQFFRRHLIRALAQQAPRSKFLCLERPVCPLTSPILHPGKLMRWIARRGNERADRDNLFVCRPFVLVHDHIATKVRFALEANRSLLRAQARRWIRKFDLDGGHILSWVFDPFQAEYIGVVDEKLSVFEYYDQYCAYREIPIFRTHADLERKERQVLARVDIVLAVSAPIAASKSHLRRDIHVVPNAADTDHFFKATLATTTVPDDLAVIPRPVVGFIGNITTRIDSDLLRSLTHGHPEWSFVFVGGTSRDGIAAGLPAPANVHFLGPKPWDALPHYLRGFDVCMIPYASHDPLNINCSPLKLYEYLATGKPIVSTDLPGVRPYEGLVRVAKDAAEFERQLAGALLERDDALRDGRLAAARANSWDERAQRILNIINTSSSL